MKWVKGIGFVLLVATVFAAVTSFFRVPEEISGPLSFFVGIGAMLFAVDRWDLV